MTSLVFKVKMVSNMYIVALYSVVSYSRKQFLYVVAIHCLLYTLLMAIGFKSSLLKYPSIYSIDRERNSTHSHKYHGTTD